MFRLLGLGIILAFAIPKADAQVLDTIRHAFKAKPRFVFSFDTRRSFIFASDAKIFGWKVGLEFDRKVRTGLGLYALTSPFYKTVVEEDDFGRPDTLGLRFEFSYFSPYFEYVLYHDKRWEFSVPIQLGLGSITLTDTTTGDIYASQGISMLEASIVGHYKFFNWVGVGSGVGYRQILSRNNTIEESLSAPIYILKLKLFVGVIYRAVFPKQE